MDTLRRGWRLILLGLAIFVAACGDNGLLEPQLSSSDSSDETCFTSGDSSPAASVQGELFPTDEDGEPWPLSYYQEGREGTIRRGTPVQDGASASSTASNCDPGEDTSEGGAEEAEEGGTGSDEEITAGDGSGGDTDDTDEPQDANSGGTEDGADSQPADGSDSSGTNADPPADDPGNDGSAVDDGSGNEPGAGGVDNDEPSNGSDSDDGGDNRGGPSGDRPGMTEGCPAPFSPVLVERHPRDRNDDGLVCEHPMGEAVMDNVVPERP